MEGITSTSFGYLIAFLLPGVITLQALGYISDEISDLLQIAKGKEPGISVILYLLVVALVSGLVISSIRDFFMDRLLCRIRWTRIKIAAFERPALDIEKLSDQHSRSLFESFVENDYRYHQFYGNMCVSLLLLFIARYLIAGIPMFDTLSHAVIFIGNIIVVVYLLFLSRSSLKSICKRMEPFAKKEEGGINVARKKR